MIDFKKFNNGFFNLFLFQNAYEPNVEKTGTN